MTLPASILWLLAGAALVALEAFGPGLGFLFIGLGAIATGVAIEVGVVTPADYVSQIAILFISSGLFAMLLWRKLKTWHTSPETAERYSNMVGDQASVGKGGLTPGKEGQVRWSGTTMRAILVADAPAVAEGATVTIVAVKGNLVTVKPN